MNKLILFLVCVFFATQNLLAQVSLTGTTSYSQTFDNLTTAGLPAGWAVFTSATSTTLGNPATFSTSAVSWATATGNFRNVASSNNGTLTSSSSASAQASAPDRALGVRQTGSFGDPGAAFAVQLSNTTGFQDFKLSLKLQSLDAGSPRKTTWAIQYGIGSAPTTFNTVATQEIGGSTFTNNTINYDFGLYLDNISEPVWIRVVALTASAGSGNRPTTGLDDFVLTYSPFTTDPKTGVLPTALAGMAYTEGSGPSSPSAFTVTARNLTPTTPVTITSPANFAVSTDGTTFTTDPLSLTPAGDGSLSQTVYTRLIAGLATGSYSGTVTISSPEVAQSKTVSLNGTVYPAGPIGPCGTSTLISAIRTAADGVTFTATGVVTSILGTNIYIQDATGGILLYTGTGTTIDLPEFEIGDEIQVTGALTTYNTDRELKDFTACFVKTATPNNPATPVAVTPATLCNNVGKLVTLSNVTTISGTGTFAGNTNYTVSDGTGNVVVRIQNGTNLVGASRPALPVNITGVVSLFNNTCQLLPRSTEDIPGSAPSTASCPEVGTGGTAISLDNTLDVAWWNVEWLGRTGYGPTNEAQQQANVAQQLINMNQDIYCLEEVTDLSALDGIIATLNTGTGKTYARACGEDPSRNPPIYYSHWWDIPEVPGDPSTYAQRVCFVYNTALVTNVTASQILAIPASLSTNAWASNRFPVLMNADVTIGGITKNLKLVGLHAKALADESSYNRRTADFASLKSYLDTTYPNDNVMIMGDYNDDADQSIYIDPVTSATFVSPFSNFVNSPDYKVITKQLSDCKISSTASYPDIIDHLTVSNEILTDGSTPTSGISYIVNSVKKFSPIVGSSTTTSDHFPIGARFQFYGPLPVNLVSFTGQAKEQGIALNWVTAWEKQNQGFDVLKGSTPQNFEKVGYVAGQVTTSAQSVYEFVDKHVQEGQLYYYQLKQKDTDGTSTLSKIIAVRAGANVTDTEPLIYPNPNPGSFTLSAKNLEAATIKLYNTFGAEIPVNVKKEQNSNGFSINTPGQLTPGLYYLRIQNADGTYQNPLKVIIR
ncbi:DUF5689 domain-containing protein [Spirosoma sp.]|uniref:DUF5689 domain-containing protein n=1 Tax=Spirosoma sp. TaxID=1899569 RepID=UPI003B3B6E14